MTDQPNAFKVFPNFHELQTSSFLDVVFKSHNVTTSPRVVLQEEKR